MLDGVAQVSAVAQAYNVKPGLSLARADFSNYGTTIDFAAPGDQIYSTAPLLFYVSGYAVADGTSMATPHVAGVELAVVARRLLLHQVNDLIARVLRVH